MPTTYLPEQSESQASESVRAIYDRIRHDCGVPMVALIFRHLATLPGALEWAWSVIGRPLEQGLLQERAWAMTRALPVKPVVTVPPQAWSHLGIDPAMRQELARLCQAYGRANPVNLVGLRLIAHCLQADAFVSDTGIPPDGVGAAAAARPRDRTWRPPAQMGPLLPMVDLHTTPADVMTLLQGLSQRGQVLPDAAFVPSFYRQLASRPALLALASLIVPVAFDRIDAAAQELRHQSVALADDLAAELGPLTPCPRELRQPMRAAIDLFTERIPEMIAVIDLMERTLPAPPNA